METLFILHFVVQELKGRTMICNKQNSENKVFRSSLTLLKIKIIEKLKLSIRLVKTIFKNKFIEVVQNLFNHLNFRNLSIGSGE